MRTHHHNVLFFIRLASPFRGGGAVAFSWLVLAGPICAQQNIAPPVTAPADFSNLVGFYLISAAVDHNEVQVEDPVTLTVSIRGNGPLAYQPQRAKLRIFPDDLGAAFYIEDLPAKDRYRKKDNTWDFVYQLRPKSDSVKEIPSLKLVYYSFQKMFQTAYSDPVPLTVKPRTAVTFDPQPLQAPAGVLQVDGSAAALRRDTLWNLPPAWLIGAGAVIPPVFCAAGYCLWRRQHREILQRRRTLRSRAAQQFLRQLQTVHRGADGLSFAELFTRYLRERLDLAVNEPTPAELDHHLKRCGVPREVRSQCAAFFEQCNRARFAPDVGHDYTVPGFEHDTIVFHVKELEQLVLALEGSTR